MMVIRKFNYVRFFTFIAVLLAIIIGIIVFSVSTIKKINYKKTYDYKLGEIGYSKEEIKTISVEEAVEKGLFKVVKEEMDDKYINKLKSLVLNPDIVKKEGEELKIVYTPLHGTGGRLVKKLFNELGYKNVHIVKEQEMPDGNFPTVSYPNPEDPKAFEYALNLAKEVDADIVLANDPDADRIGLHIKDSKTGKYILFNGNMIGLTIAEYLISQKKEKGILPKNPALIKTIVSSNMTDRICEYYGVELFLALTGFKNIAARIRQFEQNNSHNCIMGFEESYGCLIGTHARDKDGIIAVMLLCEIAAYYKNRGMTLWDAIQKMYEKYGYYREGQIPVVLEGAAGAEKIQEMMKTMRNNPPESIGKYKVLKIMDCNAGIEKDLLTGTETKLDLPKSNVLRYTLENDCWCAVRPSGTEPKIKFYMGVRGDSLESAEKDLKDLTEAMKAYTK